MREYNENISELQEQLENEHLYLMKQKFRCELLNSSYTYFKRTSEREEILRENIDDFIGFRDDLINCWNKFNTSSLENK